MSHEYDHLQTGYASLLSAALSAQPGVAVVETEEARAIGAELNRRGGELAAEIVPLSVRPDASPVVSLQVRIQDADATREQTFDGLELDAVSAKLTNELPAEVLRLSDESESGFNRQRQFELLSKRAAEFSNAGAWEHATRLRDAALLLRPHDVAQRIRQISDLRRWQLERAAADRMTRPVGGPAIPGVVDPLLTLQAFWKAADADRLDRFHRMAGHLRWLIDHRLLTQFEATYLSNATMSEMRLMSNNGYAGDTSRVTHALREFFWAVYPKLRTLPEPLDYDNLPGKPLDRWLRPEIFTAWIQSREFPVRSLSAHLPWERLATVLVLQIIPQGFSDELRGPRGPAHERAWFDSHTLTDLERVIELSDETGPLSAFEQFAFGRVGQADQLISRGRFTSEEIQSFFKRLAESDRPLIRYYGDCGLLALKSRQGQTPSEELLASSAELQLRIDRMFPGIEFPEPRYATGGLEAFRNRLAGATPSREHKEKHILRDRVPLPIAESRVLFRPIAGVVPQWSGHVRCGDSMDVLWDRVQVSVMTSPGQVRRIFPEYLTFDNEILSVAWDGESIWVAREQTGIHVLSPDGRELGRVDVDGGLPPYDTGFVSENWQQSNLGLFAVRPGQCLAVGALD